MKNANGFSDISLGYLHHKYSRSCDYFNSFLKNKTLQNANNVYNYLDELYVQYRLKINYTVTSVGDQCSVQFRTCHESQSLRICKCIDSQFIMLVKFVMCTLYEVHQILF